MREVSVHTVSISSSGNGGSRPSAISARRLNASRTRSPGQRKIVQSDKHDKPYGISHGRQFESPGKIGHNENAGCCPDCTCLQVFFGSLGQTIASARDTRQKSSLKDRRSKFTIVSSRGDQCPCSMRIERRCSERVSGWRGDNQAGSSRGRRGYRARELIAETVHATG